MIKTSVITNRSSITMAGLIIDFFQLLLASLSVNQAPIAS